MKPYTLALVKATVEPLEGNKVKVSVEVDEVEFDKAIDAAFRKIAKEVRIPGFRPGKAPRKILEQRLGSEVGRQQALHDSLDDYFQQALNEQEVDAISSEEANITAGEEEGPLAFDVVVEVRPEVQVGGYDGLRVEIDSLEAPEEDIDAQIDRMRDVQATLEEVDRPAQDDDVVNIDITGSLDGEVQENLSSEDYSYMVGSGQITPEVDDQLRGAKIGDVLMFDATHPDESEERQLSFRVLVKQVNARVLPELTDEWAAESSEFATVSELRASIRNRMTEARRAKAHDQLHERTGEALAKLVDEEPPDALVEQETQRRVQDFALRMRAQGVDLQEMMESGAMPPDMGQQFRSGAVEGVRVDLALRAVAKAEGLMADDSDVDDAIEAMAAAMNQKPRKVKDQLERGGRLAAVRSDVEKQKALDWLLERVEIVDPEGKPVERAELESTPGTDESAASGHDDRPGDTAGPDNDDTESDPE